MRPRAKRKSRAIGLGLALTVLSLVAAVSIYSSIELARFERAETRRGVFIHAAGQALASGVSVRAIDLAGTLARLGYVETRGRPGAPGQFRRAGGTWDIVPREERGGIRLEVVDGRIARVLRDGQETESAALEGEILTGGDQPGEEFRPIRLAEAPKALVDAVLSVEDHRFFQHGGIDSRGLARAAWANLRAGKVAEGGSTLTQQLVKNRLLTPRRTLTRKLREAWLATLVEWRYPKAQILEAYLNEVYLGQRGALAIRGMGAASRAYFGKEVHQLSPGEAALLAGMVRAPNMYSPALNPDRARARRDVVLARMRELDMLDAAAWERARREPVRGSRAAAAGPGGPVLHGSRAAGGGRAIRRGNAHRHHARPDAPALRRECRGRRPRPARDPIPAPQTVRSPSAPAGRPRRARPGHRRDPCLRGRTRLPGEPVRPRHAGAAPAWLRVQAVRVPGGPAAPRRGAALHGGDHGRGRAHHGHDRRQVVEPAQLRGPLRRARECPAGPRAIAQRRDRAHRPGRGPPRHRQHRARVRPRRQPRAGACARARRLRGHAD